MLWLIGSYLVLIFLIPLGLSTLVGFRALPVGRACPSCPGETLPLVVPSLQLLRRHFRAAPVEQRWCMDCGWVGLTRVEPQPRPVPVRASGRSTLRDRYETAFTETLDVRTITIDGRTWRVLLQCWNQTRHVYGRLVFVEPTGRIWTDGSEAFSGDTRFEVIGQALSVPDGLLTSRLRRILADA